MFALLVSLAVAPAFFGAIVYGLAQLGSLDGPPVFVYSDESEDVA